MGKSGYIQIIVTCPDLSKRLVLSTDPTGLEPVTDRLEGGCSIQLS